MEPEAFLSEELRATKTPIPLFKHALARFNDDQEQRFREGTTSAADLIHERAAFMDRILQLAWNRFDWNERLKSWRKTRISLLAVGGYGRSELHPHSDIDLLILLERDHYDLHRHNVQSFCTLLWDIGLEVGHSVRSIKECRNQARADVTVMTAMIEARTICGDDELLTRVNKLIAPEKIWSARDFFLAKRQEQDERHEKSGHTEFSLEPSVKTSPGGLRDIQTVMWIARRKYGTVNFDDLVKLEFLTPREGRTLTTGRELLWKIRFALHMVSGKEDDRLLFEHQQKLAAMFGYTDGNQLAVEQFMQSYYRTALEVNHTSRLLLQHFEEEILQTGSSAKIEPVNERFQFRNGYLEAIHDNVFIDYPPALMEMFVIMGNTEDSQGVRASTIRLVRRDAHLINDEFRQDPVVTGYFMDLLRSRYHLFSQLRRMVRYGILGAYLPEFARVVGQMQFDLFHIYTVDAHTLQVVRHMRRFRYVSEEQQFPIAAHIHHRLPKVELLYIAGLYHDIAKGMGGDHSELGVEQARAFCERHGLGTWDTNLVCWLVRNHLVMSTTSQRKDIQDPEVIHEFALLIQDQVRLDYLYSLTVADINATNPTLWNSWRATLLSQLYVETKKMLRNGLENYVDRSEYVQETQNHAIARLAEHGLTRDEILGIWNNVDDDYFIGESVADITWHTAAIRDHDLESGPLILIRDDVSRRRMDEGSTQIFVHMTNARRIFSSIVSALGALGLEIMDARIASSSSNLVFDTFTVLEADGQPVGNNAVRRDRIINTIRKYLEPGHVPKSRGRRTPRALKQFKVRTEVSISHSQNHSILDVTALDRPGLLAIIADILAELDIDLQSAKITTLGERVEDIFHLSKDGAALLDKDLQETLTSRICDELDSTLDTAVAS
ncbi:MAG: [protein-PII] uridylyltransferase [Proteobacteria bacterium]|nr:[protein-PII] uridylyltransferase [Pseudomonadota bacterium]